MSNKSYTPAPLYKRFAALVLDAIVASLPLVVMLYFFTSNITTPAPLLYPAPAIGAATVIELPLQVNHYMNEQLPGGDKYEDTQLRNVSFGATAGRIASVFVILFYLGYATVCTALYDGHTVGKYVMGLTVIRRNPGSLTKAVLLRELLGKVLLNSTGIVLIISVFTILFTKKHLAVHDFIGSTEVVLVNGARASGVNLLDISDEDEEPENDDNDSVEE